MYKKSNKIGKIIRVATMIFSKIIITLATSKVVAADFTPPSLVPHRPLTPQLPAKVVTQLEKNLTKNKV